MDGSVVQRSFIDGVEAENEENGFECAVSLATGVADRLRKTSSYDRASVLSKVARTLSENASEIAKALADESGFLTVKDMQLEVQRATEVFTLTAAFVQNGLTESLHLDVVDRGRGVIGYVTREPIGPILGISAFNAPLLIPSHKIAPAIAVGAPIVLKPSPRVPMASVRLARAVIMAGWPKEAISVVDVDNPATMKLIRDPRLPVISFTGGSFGWNIKKEAPYKHVVLELGGVGAVFVAADANIALAAKECAAGGFVRSGQSCISVQRIYVERSQYEAFLKAFVGEVKKLAPGTDAAIGPLVDESAAKRVEGLVKDAISRGATLLCGGERQGAYVPPTVVSDATSQMLIMQNEAFGPVVAVSSIDGADAAISEMNAVTGAIHHGIFTADLDTALRMASEIRAGGVIVNGPSTWRVDNMPYGGTGTSGFGREGIKSSIEEFSEPKTVVIRPPMKIGP